MRTQRGHDQPARAALHGRDLRLLPAGREPAVEDADADAAQAGAAPSASASCSPRRTRWTSTTRGCRTRAPGSSAACRPSATRRACSTGSRARRRGAGQSFDRGQMEQTLAGLGSRVFLMNNVHEDEPVVFETRWAMSYLRGPLGRQEIRKLTDSRQGRQRTAGSRSAAPASVPATRGTGLQCARNHLRRRAPSLSGAAPRPVPVLPPSVSQFFLPVRGSAPAGARLVYQPMLFGAAQVRFADPKAKVEASETLQAVTPVARRPPCRWTGRRPPTAPFTPGDLESEPAAGASFAPLPPTALKPKSYDAWQKAFVSWVYGSRKLSLFRSSALSLVSNAGRDRGRLPRSPAAGRARAPRPGGGRAARAVRRSGWRNSRTACAAPRTRASASRTRPARRRCRPPSRSARRCSAR